MEAFAYLSVLISIVLDLRITETLVGCAGWLHRRDEFHGYAPAMAWGAVLLLIHAQSCWSMYGLQYHQTWTFLPFIVVLFPPVVKVWYVEQVVDTRHRAIDRQNRMIMPWYEKFVPFRARRSETLLE